MNLQSSNSAFVSVLQQFVLLLCLHMQMVTCSNNSPVRGAGLGDVHICWPPLLVSRAEFCFFGLRSTGRAAEAGREMKPSLYQPGVSGGRGGATEGEINMLKSPRARSEKSPGNEFAHICARVRSCARKHSNTCTPDVPPADIRGSL